MKQSKSENNNFINESFVGGASLSLDDIETVQSREIKWVKLITDETDLDEKPIAA